ncbi:MAG: UDP-GlcNAc:undecaprenyl-phosphate GlcNAc-phosphate transferase [Deltaproteobacteria bacterium]|jgi:UDP-GlcNAc:undecaprenyl-phosphate GlcNAc-1-phosphate transferase|nr:UDP-GlcNAc:undecaprenyl-phosphate GlcNAc-phosphate transferase [Deltaproteobacteria bacterium]MBP2685108.1 UDP-GlcNAc:undecaprenyl-phosphate GlcNAc-phosphate transferase [Deltaproteobacteria bacterium]
MEELISQKHIVWLFFSSLFLSIVLTPRTRALAVLLGAVDTPDPRKVHGRAIPRLGGLGIAVSVVLFLYLFGKPGMSLNGFLIGAILTALVGFLDDVFHFRPLYKFFGQIVAAAAFVFLGDCYIQSLGDIAAIGEIRLEAHAPWFTVFCMVGVMNALNLSDGLDGLAGGISAIACFFLGLFSILQGDSLSLSITVCLLGSLFGFLRYNSFPAKLFMGDTGSMLLGYSLAAVAVRLAEFGGAVRFSPMTFATVLALPILDTLLVMGRRALRCENPFLPDKTHLHHQLLDLGLSHAAVVPILYGLMTVFGVVAWGMRDFPEWMQFASVVALGAFVYGALPLFGRIGPRIAVSLKDGTLYRGTSSPIRKHHGLARSVPLVSWLIGIGLCVPALLSAQVRGKAGLVSFSMATFIFFLFPWQGRRRHAALCHGVLYASCVCLVGILHLGNGAASWVVYYMVVFSIATLAWALLMTKSRPLYGKLLVPSGFETLLIVLCLLIPLIVVPALGLAGSMRKTILLSCFESMPFLLAFKIIVRRKPVRNQVFAIAFLVTFLLLGIHGTLSADNVWGSSPVPAETKAPGCP